MEKTLSSLCKLLEYNFNDVQLLKEAVTHRSFAAEYSIKYDNQRLEFFGDAVIQLIITEMIYNLYPDEKEGVLTKIRAILARQEALAKLARSITLSEYLRLGRGEYASGGHDRNSILCDAFEALAGAIYIDGGYAVAEKIIKPLFQKNFPDPYCLLNNSNPKGKLQEFAQKNGVSHTPKYSIDAKSGPDHDCVYTVSVCIRGEVVATGTGRNRKSAEESAAQKALEILQSDSSCEKT